jgi:hypothetical protein
MAGFWEIWDVPSRNMLADARSEQEALAIVREIVGEGAAYSDLTLLFDDPDLDVEALPPPVTGDELARRAVSSGAHPIPQTLLSERHLAEEGYRLFYRIVKTNPPDLFDMQSARVRGNPEPPDPERRAVWDGLSVFSTLSQARRKQRTSPGIGSYIAVLRVPTDGSVRIERTLRDAGHHTIWAEAALLLKWVVSVELAKPVH